MCQIRCICSVHFVKMRITHISVWRLLFHFTYPFKLSLCRAANGFIEIKKKKTNSKEIGQCPIYFIWLRVFLLSFVLLLFSPSSSSFSLDSLCELECLSVCVRFLCLYCRLMLIAKFLLLNTEFNKKCSQQNDTNEKEADF